ncbi:imidazole-4-carboxamide isomerase [Golovinomyces cichoracearum]|uniref:1-(5-phosphoribosyl)-5-[(5-phosphoribosylamino)methylideneamino] imidazole-4-carboxamide isomerase n=1 Tax=Golovinomyces cichoracearum TaxID=62708 RepID=A0A420H739_9PEZI|nr:imidazole-4-carboxamide isomerase [Golovinomyces cichoracearum]
MTKFRPCIDLHLGQVKQIVGGTLTITPGDLKTNYVSELPAKHFAKLYKANNLRGSHIIMLGPGNEDVVKETLLVWQGSFQVGGGITDLNAKQWIEWGAEKARLTRFSKERLMAVLDSLGNDKDKLVIDLSCRRKENSWYVAIEKWQKITDMEVNEDFTKTPRVTIKMLEPYCSEFLIHAADHEGLQQGIDESLVRNLAKWCRIPVTYAGGGRNINDLKAVKEISNGRVDLTIGSALDIFGGSGILFDECVKWNRDQEKEQDMRKY